MVRRLEEDKQDRGSKDMVQVHLVHVDRREVNVRSGLWVAKMPKTAVKIGRVRIERSNKVAVK